MRLDARPELDAVGVWTWPLVTAPADHVRLAAREIEQMGYRTVWYPESRGRDAISLAAIILAATTQLTVATGIANIWARDADAAAGAAMSLGDAWPGRFTLGLGVSHAPSVAARGHEYVGPLERMQSYLDGIESARYVGPEPVVAVPVLLAALGPKMLELAARRTGGAHPYFVPVEHTAFAREVMGDGAYLAPEQAAVLETEPDAARAVARSHMAGYLRLDNYRRNLLRMGWSDADVSNGGSDALVDAIVAWGPPEAIAERVAAHHEAGADHVCIQLLTPDETEVPLAGLERLAGVAL
jgi:probable F420-dependent oxidoreductase